MVVPQIGWRKKWLLGFNMIIKLGLIVYENFLRWLRGDFIFEFGLRSWSFVGLSLSIYALTVNGRVEIG